MKTKDIALKQAARISALIHLLDERIANKFYDCSDVEKQVDMAIRSTQLWEMKYKVWNAAINNYPVRNSTGSFK